MTCSCLRLCLCINHNKQLKPTQNIKTIPPQTNNELFPSTNEKSSTSSKEIGRSVGNKLGSSERGVGEKVGDLLGSAERVVGETVGDRLGCKVG